ncbi:TRAP transporter substrate-binding protein [Microbaculum marinum]|uniref:TRAP transporter substrate-binding protein n=1 Tax=Microbaculum marinum TaxID=1764581 RepID=A0AAW9RMR7_9HYPH
MTRRHLSALLVSAAVAIAAAAPAAAQEYKILLGTAASPPHPFYEAGRMWKEEVEKRSNGRVEVQYLHSRQLGEERPLFEGVLSGTVDAMVGSSISLTVFANKSSFEALQLPFLISSYDTLAEVLSSDAAMDLLADLDSSGIKGYSLFEGGQRHYLSTKGPVRTMSDLAGMKTRVMNMPMHLAIWEQAGAAPVGMNYGEIYTSLETGVIDGVEINVSSLESERFYEAAKHFTYTGHYFWPGMLIGNKAKFDSLPENIQQIMIEAGRDIIVPQVMATKEAEAAIAKRLAEEEGVQFYEFEEKDEMRKVMEPFIEERVQSDPAIAAFVETVREIEGR